MSDYRKLNIMLQGNQYQWVDRVAIVLIDVLCQECHLRTTTSSVKLTFYLSARRKVKIALKLESIKAAVGRPAGWLAGSDEVNQAVALTG